MISPILGTAIGLALVFLLTATLVTIITEAISGVMTLRAKALENTIAHMIEDVTAKPSIMRWFNGMFGAHAAGAPSSKAAVTAARHMMKGGVGIAGRLLGAVNSLTARLAPPKTGVPPLAQDGTSITYDQIYNHPLVGGLDSKNAPSYVPSENFAIALLHVLGQNGGGTAYYDVVGGIAKLPPGGLKTTLEALVMRAAGDAEVLRKAIEGWFNGAMDRLSGDYKRFTQVIAFFLALVLAVCLNIDAVHIGQRLYAEPALRDALAKAAEARIAQKPVGEAKAIGEKETKANIKSAEDNLNTVAPVGWAGARTWCQNKAGDSICKPKGDWKGLRERLYRPENPPLAILGWLITALAAMAGAPFWFDTLSKLVNLRNAGPKPNSPGAAK